MEKGKRLWVCSGNDLETAEIIKLLEHENETCLTVSSVQNMPWKSVSFQIQSLLRRNSDEKKDIYVLGVTDSPYNELKSDESQSKLEQVSDVLGENLTIDQQFISAYAKSGEQGIHEFAGLLEIPNDQVAEIVKDINGRDRQAQGITIQQEAEAVKAIRLAKEKGDFTYVQIPHNKIRTVLDRVNVENIAIICPEGETYIKANRKYIDLLSDKFGNNKELREKDEFRNIGKQKDIMEILVGKEIEQAVQRA